jgi:hypothetical protein
MDYDNPQFIAAVKKVLEDSLAQLTDGLKNLEDAVGAHWESDEKRYQTKPVAVTDLRTNVPIPIQNKTKKSVPEWIWIIFKGVLEILGIAAVIAYTYVSYHQWCEMQKQTRTGQKQVEQSERAWLTVAITADSDFTFDKDGGARISVRPHIHNIGKSPATGIILSAKMILAPMSTTGDRFFHEPIAQQNELCDKIAKTPVADGKTTSDFQQVIFPNDGDESVTNGLAVSKAEIDAAKKDVIAKSGPESLLSPFVVGCVDYQYATALQHHQTGFVYALQHHDRTLPPNIYPIRAIRVGHPIKAADVEIQKWPFGGFYAY